MTIAVLGPLSVDGHATSLSPRDRVVLEVLVVRLGEFISAERLADAMWGDLPPNSWNKVLQGCVVRLRKLLGVAAIETSSAGYRLTTLADDVDAHRFERMVGRSLELLTLGEHERAAFVSGEALALWRGPALSELEGWDSGRIEAGRLDELRLDAQEVHLDASLRSGRHREVLGEAQARVAEAPLRERRWSLLALAQYQAGRQGDALRTLHRARRVLAEDLGVEPGPDLVALEQAILRQDASLVAAAALPDPGAVCPYLGLLPYDIDDTDGFFGRDADVETCLGRLTAVGVLAVVGPSGSGKSSLVRAGVAAALQRNGQRVAVISPGARPTDSLTAVSECGRAPVLVVDQCEEALTLCDDTAEQARFFAALAAHAELAPLIVALRADRLGELSAHPSFARLVEPGLHLLSAMSEADLRAAIEGPARQVGLLLEPGLVDLLVREVEGEPGALPLLSHALHETWQRREGRTLTVEGYQRTGGIRGSVAQSAEQVYDQVPDEQRPLLRDLLLRLVTPTPEGEPVRSRVPRRTVATDPEHEKLIELLVRARLVTSDDDTVEIAHESLARAWPRLRNWLDDDVEGQRILRHLAVTADAWDAMGRPDSELYRGARLAQALDWQTNADRDLTPSERAFLDTSTARERAEAETIEQRLREQTRQNRRLRALLVGVAGLLVIAMVAGLLAVRQANRADRAAIAADARRVGAQALVVDNIDQSLLLGVEGVRLDDSPDTRANLVAALSRSPELIGVIRGDTPSFISVTASPDGDVVVVVRAYSGMSFYDTDTRQLMGSYDGVTVWQSEFSPDGKQIAVGAQFGRDGELPQPSVRLVDAGTLEDDPVQLGGTPENADPGQPRYSADGRFLVVSFALPTADNDGLEVKAAIVWDLASPRQPVRRVDVAGAGDGAALSPDGGLLYVGRRDPATLAVFDVATGRPLMNTNVPTDSLEVSPDGSLVAAVAGNDIVLLDAATLTERGRLGGHSDGITGMRFSHSGALLASGSADRTVIVWDVATRQPLQQLRGHVGAVWGVDFSPDDRTLYSAGLDGALLIWDLVGDRRFIPGHPIVKPVSISAPGSIHSPSGEAVAYTTSANGAALLQFLDMRTGRAGDVIDTHHRFYGDSVWRPDGRRFATAGDDGAVRVWDWRTGELIAERDVAPGHISSLAYTDGGKRLVVAEGAGAVYTVDAETLQPDGPRIVLTGYIRWVYASPDNHTAIALMDVSDEGRFALVDVDTGRVLHEGDVGFIPDPGDFSPDGHRFAVSGLVGDLRVLDVDTGEWVGPPRSGHNGGSWHVAYAPDGAIFASGGWDNTIGLWDGRTGAPLYRLQLGRHTDARPEFLLDGHTVLISTQDGSVYTWDTRPEIWVKAACAIAGRNLTRNEWRDAFGNRPYRPTCPTTDQS